MNILYICFKVYFIKILVTLLFLYVKRKTIGLFDLSVIFDFEIFFMHWRID